MIQILTLQIICANILAYISDHFQQFLNLRNANTSFSPSDNFKYDYLSFNERHFIADFTEIGFSYLNNASDTNTNYTNSYTTSLATKHVPIKMCSKREVKFEAKQFLKTRIQKKMKLGDQILRKLKKNKSENNFDSYKKLHDKHKADITDNREKMKKLWS